MPNYEAEVLEEFAERMYSKAAGATVHYAFLGIVIGLAVAWILGLLQLSKGTVGSTVWLVCGSVGAIGGVFVGIDRAFWWKLEAQRVLVLKQIEANTRPPTPESPGAAPEKALDMPKG